ncbi:MAG: enoyl-CoA hydratase [Deltaproteobacteria bacterium]|nr:enoyl-CoA hydratase [Deltaproteobacteria bacterium]
MPEEPYVTTEVERRVATVTMRRPRSFNALSWAMLDALEEHVTRAAEDPAVHAVVLAGEGKAFCAGHDLKEMRAHPDEAWQRALFDRCGRLMLALRRAPVPVLARVQGIATAAGCQLVAQCDLAVCARSAAFATSGVNLGLYCATPAVALSRAISPRSALELTLTGRFLQADEALALGLVQRVAEGDNLDQVLGELTAALADKPRSVLVHGKATFWRQRDLGLEDALAFAAEAMARNMSFPEATEGIDAFLQRREPAWRRR